MASISAPVTKLAGSVAGEVESLRRDLPRVEIQSATNAFLTATYGRTRYARVKVTLTFPDGYPAHHPLIVNVARDDVVPPGLKKKLERDLESAATEVGGEYGQVQAVFRRLMRFVDSNLFLPCWRELRQCVELVGGLSCVGGGGTSKAEERSTISAVETKGKLKIALRNGRYFYRFSAVIDPGYPSTLRHEDYGRPCAVQMEGTNFPPKIEVLLTSQARDLVNQLQDGMASEDALRKSNPVRLPKTFKDNKREPTEARLTQKALKGLKHDIETLSQVRDLREVNAATKGGDARVKSHSKRERKDARRDIKKITDKEIAMDAEQEEKDRQWQLEEKARLAGYKFTELDGSNPQPSLLTLVTFLAREVQRLPEERCPVCGTRTLPSDPEELMSLYLITSGARTEKEKRERKLAKKKRPMRTYCGCWYHHSCLDKFMTEPPFGAECPTEDCGRRVYHPEWPGDMSELERAWASHQARSREIEDAGMFF